MIVTTPRDFPPAVRGLPASGPPVLRAALLVSPHGFRVSRESARDNRYVKLGAELDLERAHAEHRALVEKLGELGVPVILFRGKEGQDDGVYPNNVFATVPGRFIVGSMRHDIRREEAGREDIRSLFSDTFCYELVDLSEREGTAELTGPLVIDRPRRIGLCGLSGRADEAGCRAMHEAFALSLTFRFALVPEEYHANLVLSVLAGRLCVIHPPSLADPEAADAIMKVYEERVVVLTDEEKNAFAGNCLAVTERDVLFSRTSLDALRPSSASALEAAGFRLHGVAIDELEKGGGSLRCMIAEVF